MQQKVEELEQKIKQRDSLIDEFKNKEEQLQKKFDLENDKFRETSFEKDN